MAGKEDPTLRSDTRLVTSGRSGAFAEAVVNPPVWRASTHLYASCADLRERKADIPLLADAFLVGGLVSLGWALWLPVLLL